MNKVIELVLRDDDDQFRYIMHESHVLKSYTIDKNHFLYKRFMDIRTPYEQYCAGERYIKYDENRLYSRAAHEHMIRYCNCHLYIRKNYRIKVNYGY